MGTLITGFLSIVMDIYLNLNACLVHSNLHWGGNINISTSASISFSSADICTSSSDLNFLQIFLLKMISTSFVASMSLSSGDILPSSSYLNFSVVYCTCGLCCLLQNWFVSSLCTAHHLKARPGSSSCLKWKKKNKKMKVKLM